MSYRERIPTYMKSGVTPGRCDPYGVDDDAEVARELYRGRKKTLSCQFVISQECKISRPGDGVLCQCGCALCLCPEHLWEHLELQEQIRIGANELTWCGNRYACCEEPCGAKDCPAQWGGDAYAKPEEEEDNA